MQTLSMMYDDSQEKIIYQKKLLRLQKEICDDLRSKNDFLSQRSKQLTRMKLVNQLSTRTMMIGDSAIFSDYFGYMDEVVLKTELDVCEKLPSCGYDSFKLYRSESGYEYHKALLPNGELLSMKVLKKCDISKPFYHSKVLYEAKILKLIGNHKNLADYHGICFIKDVPALVFSFDSQYSLRESLAKNPIIDHTAAAQIIQGICDGLSFIHDKDILHNNLSTGNVCLQIGPGYYQAVIMNFSYACREQSSKRLTVNQTKLFETAYHMVSDVRLGRIAPSKKSDIHSFGHIVNKIGCCIIPSKEQRKILCLAYKCFDYKKGYIFFKTEVELSLCFE